MSEETSTDKKKKQLYVVVAVLVIASVAFRLIDGYHFEQTSILFIGLPALITLLMVKYTSTPKSPYGISFRVITIFLLMSSILLGEGIVCVLFAAPIFYGLAALLVFVSVYLEKRNKSNLNSIVLLPLVVLLAQPLDFIKEPKIQTVETISIVQKGSSIETFNQEPNLMKNLPSFFKIGFPKPVGISESGTELGDHRNIEFESSTKGIGTLSLEVVERSVSSITFKAISDDTHVNHWLTWKQMKVELIDTNTEQPKIIWTTQYQCDLGPSWYFEPLEEIAVKKMNKHLIDVYFN